MAENYCGRSCENCELKEQLKCPGCKEGPGSEALDQCEVAACCRIKMQDFCGNCTSREVCENIQSHQEVPKYIQEKLKSNTTSDEKLRERVKVAGKWKQLFYWGVALLVVSFLLDDAFGAMGEAICMFGMATVLLRMAPAEKGYNAAGYCQLGYAATIVLSLLLPEGASEFIGFAGATASFIADCMELHYHGIMLTGIDDELAGKWKSICKWLIIACCVMLVSVVILFIEPELGVVVLVIVAIGMFVIRILRLVYLHKSAYVFEGLAKTLEYREDMAGESINEYNSEE